MWGTGLSGAVAGGGTYGCVRQQGDLASTSLAPPRFGQTVVPGAATIAEAVALSHASPVRRGAPPSPRDRGITLNRVGRGAALAEVRSNPGGYWNYGKSEFCRRVHPMRKSSVLGILLVLGSTGVASRLIAPTKANATPDACYECADRPSPTGKPVCNPIPCPDGVLSSAALNAMRDVAPTSPSLAATEFKRCFVGTKEAMCRTRKESPQ